MKLSRELKTAVLVISAMLLCIWGYSYLKGKNLINTSKKLYVVYENVSGLATSAPVTLNGLKVGRVNAIDIQEDGKLLVQLQIDTDFPISKTSTAEIYDVGLMGGREIAILPNFSDKNPTQSGDYLKAANKLGLMASLSQGIEPAKDKLEQVLQKIDVLVTNLNQVLDTETKNNLKNSIAELNTTIKEFSGASKKVNQLLADNKAKLDNTLINFDKTTQNFASISDDLKKAELGKTVEKLDNTLLNADKIINDIQQGKGSMGKLMKDETLYNNFTRTSKELELLLQDLRLHPTRYINVSVFGKKEKPYVSSEKPN